MKRFVVTLLTLMMSACVSHQTDGGLESLFAWPQPQAGVTSIEVGKNNAQVREVTTPKGAQDNARAFASGAEKMAEQAGSPEVQNGQHITWPSGEVFAGSVLIGLGVLQTPSDERLREFRGQVLGLDTDKPTPSVGASISDRVNASWEFNTVQMQWAGSRLRMEPCFSAE